MTRSIAVAVAIVAAAATAGPIAADHVSGSDPVVVTTSSPGGPPWPPGPATAA
jgi:hypothetical protein